MPRRTFAVTFTLACLVLATAATASADTSTGPVAPAGTWTEQTTPTAADLTDVAFADALHGWTVGADGTIAATTDGGWTWTAQRSAVSVPLLGVDFSTTASGWAVGGEARIVQTTDGGAKWSQVPPPDVTVDLFSAVSFADAQRGLVVGADDTILLTSDGGRTWRAVASGGTNDWLDVTFADGQNAWVAGVGIDAASGQPVGRILRSTDGGLTWNESYRRDDETIAALSFSGADSGWATAGSGTILVCDGGTWRAWTMGMNVTMRGVCSIDEREGWAVGTPVDRQPGDSAGLIVHSTDGGRSWAAEGQSDVALNDVTFVSPYEGWAVGDGGTILHYASGPAVGPSPHPPTTSSPSPTASPPTDEGTDWTLVGAVIAVAVAAVAVVALLVTRKRR